MSWETPWNIERGTQIIRWFYEFSITKYLYAILWNTISLRPRVVCTIGLLLDFWHVVLKVISCGPQNSCSILIDINPSLNIYLRSWLRIKSLEKFAVLCCYILSIIQSPAKLTLGDKPHHVLALESLEALPILHENNEQATWFRQLSWRTKSDIHLRVAPRPCTKLKGLINLWLSWVTQLAPPRHIYLGVENEKNHQL